MSGLSNKTNLQPFFSHRHGSDWIPELHGPLKERSGWSRRHRVPVDKNLAILLSLAKVKKSFHPESNLGGGRSY
jgi:hypothetical protein